MLTVIAPVFCSAHLSPKTNNEAYLPTNPIMTSFNPTSGTVGSTVVITGSGFDASNISNNSVTIGLVNAPVSAVSATQITVSIPKDASGGYITVTVNGQGTSLDTKFIVIPTITGFSPASASVGSTITINGTGFGKSCGAYCSTSDPVFKSESVTAFVINQTDTTITAIVPIGAITGPIKVNQFFGGSATSLIDFIVPIVVTDVVNVGSPYSNYTGKIGDDIYIEGSGFDASNISNNTVTFNGISAPIIGVYFDHIAIKVPGSATTGPIVVTVGGQVLQIQKNFVVVSTITNISPNRGTVGTIITITGTGFDLFNPANNKINFNGATASGILATPTSLTVKVPLGAGTGYLSLLVNGQPASVDLALIGEQIYFQTIPTVWSLNPSSGIEGDTLIITGNGFDLTPNHNAVLFNGNALGQVISVTDTTLICVVPNQCTTGPVLVFILNNLSALNRPLFTMIPHIASFSPTTCLAGALTTLTISGGFKPNGVADTVIFSPGIKVPAYCRNYTCNTLSVTIPANIVTGPVRVKVDNQIVTSKDNLVVTKDTIPPTINVPTSIKKIVEGSPFNLIALNLEDNALVSKATIHYRGISEFSWRSIDFPIGAQHTPFDFKIKNSWYDGLGLEYYITATDPSGNSGRSPQSQGGYYSAVLINASVSIPDIPFGSKSTDYQIISFPYLLDSNSTFNKVKDVLKEIVDNPSTGGFYEYSPQNSKSNSEGYLSYATKEFDTMAPGIGYWILTKTQQVSNSVPNIPSPVFSKKNLFKLPLQPKWNLIGNPYPQDVSWNEVLALNNNPNIHSLSTFNGGWEVSDILPAFRGGFVYNSGTITDTLFVPFKGQHQIGGRIVTTNIGTDISSDSWNISLYIFQETHFNKLGGFGMHPLAVTGPDRFDNFNPPGLRASTEVSFEHTEFPNLKFSNDMVKTTDSQIWQFVANGSNDELTTLTWNTPVISGTQKLDLLLYDEKNSRFIDMKERNNYQFISQGSNRFTISFGNNITILPRQIRVSNPYPNPLQSDRTALIDLSLPESLSGYRISYKLFNISALEVGSYSFSVNPGLQTVSLMFDPSLSGGLYFYRLVVNSQDSSYSVSGKIIVH